MVYDDAQQRAEQRKQRRLLQARHSLRHALEWQRVDVPADLGVDCGNYKWRQNQSCVEVFVRMPENVATSKVLRKLVTSGL